MKKKNATSPDYIKEVSRITGISEITLLKTAIIADRRHKAGLPPIWPVSTGKLTR